jgi:AhpD family alkylhydroperoxidase
VRIDYGKVMPRARDAMLNLQRAADATALEPRLVELVKIRASQLNGCAYCLDMHTKDARAIGEDEERLHLVAAWREAPCFSERERAALAWTESLTLLPETGAPDEVYERARARFTDEELVGLTFEIVAINGWNRLAVGMRTTVGGYVSRRKPGTRT